jgi:hypothetical protein
MMKATGDTCRPGSERLGPAPTATSAGAARAAGRTVKSCSVKQPQEADPRQAPGSCAGPAQLPAIPLPPPSTDTTSGTTAGQQVVMPARPALNPAHSVWGPLCCRGRHGSGGICRLRFSPFQRGVTKRSSNRRKLHDGPPLSGWGSLVKPCKCRHNVHKGTSSARRVPHEDLLSCAPLPWKPAPAMYAHAANPSRPQATKVPPCLMRAATAGLRFAARIGGLTPAAPLSPAPCAAAPSVTARHAGQYRSNVP